MPRNIYSASAKSKPCFRMLERFLASSHSKVIVTPIVATSKTRQISRRRSPTCDDHRMSRDWGKQRHEPFTFLINIRRFQNWKSDFCFRKAVASGGHGQALRVSLG